MTEILSLFQRSFRLKIISMLGLTVLADFLFYEHQIGWTLGLFGLLMVGACVLHNPRICKSIPGQIILLLTVGQCVLQIEKTSLLCFTLMFMGIISLAVLSQGGWKEDAAIWLRRILSATCRVLRPLNQALIGFKKYRQRYLPPNHFARILRGWFLPIVLSCVFIALFANANPIMTKWFSGINFIAMLNAFSMWRAFFWLVIASFVFSVIRPKLKPLRKRPAMDVSIKKTKPMGFSEWAFTKEAVLRSLVIFNLMFAFQTMMDMNYLWAGGALPAGISYAQYAQNGAYPLIVTALLAAAFVLITQNAGHEVSGTKTVRALIYAWVAQNIMLVISSIYRTGLYVEVYALTYWRVAAFIWMGLVAAGLCWIIVRSLLGKSNTWLINANVITLLVVLYVTSFVNLGAIIADYNVMHSKAVSGKGVELDTYYLEGIGSAAIPALIKYSQYGKVHDRFKNMSDGINSRFIRFSTISEMTDELKHDMDDWRRWTYSEYRMLKYLESHKK